VYQHHRIVAVVQAPTGLVAAYVAGDDFSTEPIAALGIVEWWQSDSKDSCRFDPEKGDTHFRAYPTCLVDSWWGNVGLMLPEEFAMHSENRATHYAGTLPLSDLTPEKRAEHVDFFKALDERCRVAALNRVA
jgi:hypothetical protein